MLGALINALGAIALGAPIGIQYIYIKDNQLVPSNVAFYFTCNLSYVFNVGYPFLILLEYLLVYLQFVPAASVFGSSWADWQRIFAHTK
ncbi:hypothetical protein JRO89_XS09G0089700 [Xanthoceras sorbifolium]|uniref:Uncharacterized protein n=1 Tax=Xanthoceras sorbifolium TaxID=99658 RepID=A0ABQ8HL10_9ROSI|nr:hypothetical protein JRO89_XS09G0089700 [Xanthoceras sorbifolium]